MRDAEPIVSPPTSPPRPLFGQAVRGVVIASGADFFVKLSGIAATAIILTRIDPYEYGLWQLILSVIMAFSVPLLPAIAGMLVADIARRIGMGEKQKANALLVRSAILFAFLGLASSLAMFFAAPYLTNVSGLQLTSAVRVLAFALLASGVGQGLTMVFQTRLEFARLQANKVLGRVTYLVSITLFLLVFHMDLMGLVYAYLIAAILPTAVYIPYMVRAYRRFYADYEASNWSEFFSELKTRGVWVIFSDIASVTTGTLWPWVVGYFLGIPMVGIVSIGLTFLSQVSASIPVSTVLRPMLPRTVSDPQRVAHWIVRSMKYTLWLHLALGILAFGAFSIVAPVFFPKYVIALPLAAALLLSLPFRALGLVATEWYYTTGKQKELFFYSRLFGLGLFVLMVPFLALGGIFGYVLYVIFSGDLLLLARLRIMRRDGGIYVKWRELLRIDRQDEEYIQRIIDGTLRQLSRRLTPRAS